MSLFEMSVSPRYVKIVFDDEEIGVIRAACTAVALQERYVMMEETSGADLETAAGQAKKASDAGMAEGMASMFKPGQPILIEPEDMALVLDSLKSYGRSPPEEHAAAVKKVIEKIERYFR